MPQKERPDEAAARARVEDVLEVSVTFADLRGGVDYRFERDGRSGALEVVRLTDAVVKEGANAWGSGNQMYEFPGLRSSWWVVTDGHPIYKGLRERLGSTLRTLELHHLGDYDASAMDWWVRHVPTLQDALDVLQSARVSRAKPIKTKGTIPQIHLSPSGAWSLDGPNGAVDEVAEYLTSTEDVRRKLAQSNAEERHASVWTDYNTPGRVRHPLEGGGDSLPSVPPELPREITHLWLVDEPTGRGWHWSPDSHWMWT